MQVQISQIQFFTYKLLKLLSSQKKEFKGIDYNLNTL